MFSVGDRVVHPLHGAGTIRALTEKEIHGNRELYYALELALDNIKVYLPVKTCRQNGIRPLCSVPYARKVLAGFSKIPLDEQTSWNRRYHENMLRIRSGDLKQVAQAARNLQHREQTHGLSTGEKRMLQSAQKILVSELSFVLNCPPEQIMQQMHWS